MTEKTLHRWFTDSLQRVPHDPALDVDGVSLSYSQLSAAADHIAEQIRQGGGPLTYATYLAALRAGGSVVPLSLDHPAERGRFITRAAGVDVVVTAPGPGPDWVDEHTQVLTVDETELLRTAEADPRRTARAADRSGREGGPAGGEPAEDPEQVVYVLFTSGSTGRPKGVPIRHRNLDAFLRHNIARYAVGPGCRLSQTFDLTFDPSVFDMFVAWGAGATLVVPSRAELLDPVSFVNEKRITHWYSVPSIVSAARRAGTLAPGSMPGLRWSLFAGEQFTLAQAADWAEAAPASSIENLYGPTELSVTVTAYRLPRERSAWPHTSNSTVPIGRVYPHLEHRLTAEGELLVRGPQRFGGYLDPADDAGRFHTEPPAVAGASADAWYRTGDRVAEEGGELVHHGRVDHQVKILGRRIELEEVEAALLRLPGVTEAAVVALAEADGDLRLGAVHTGQGTGEPLRTAVAAVLPGYMVPHRLLRVDQLPLNVSGKVDRAACRKLLEHQADDATPDSSAAGSAAPAGAADPAEILLAVLRANLPTRDTGLESEFSTSGGDSLIAIRVVNEARERGLPLTVRELLLHQTPRGMLNSPALTAVRVGDATGRTVALDDEPDDQPYALLPPADRDRLPQGLADALPASALQVGMLYHCELSPGSLLYHVMDGWEVGAPFDERAFRPALAELVRRHPALRSSFALGMLSAPAQLVWEEASLPLTVEQAGDAQEAGALVRDWCHQHGTRPIDWAAAPLARCHVVAEPASFQVILAAHHAVLDGWSFARLTVELMTLYDAALGGALLDSAPASPSVQRDFIRAERAAAAAPAAAAHWAGQADAPALLSSGVPQDRIPDPAESHAVALDAELVAALTRASRMLGVPVKSLALAAHARALGTLTGRETDVVTGLVFNTRPESAGSHLAAGLFLNTLPVRFGTVDDTWSGLARTAARLEQDGAGYQAYPQAALVEQLGRPAFDVTFNFMHFHAYQELDELPALPVRGWWRRGKPSFPFHVNVEITGDSGQFRIGFDHTFVSRELVERYARLLHRCLTALSANPVSPAAQVSDPGSDLGAKLGGAHA